MKYFSHSFRQKSTKSHLSSRCRRIDEELQTVNSCVETQVNLCYKIDPRYVEADFQEFKRILEVELDKHCNSLPPESEHLHKFKYPYPQSPALVSLAIHGAALIYNHFTSLHFTSLHFWLKPLALICPPLNKGVKCNRYGPWLSLPDSVMALTNAGMAESMSIASAPKTSEKRMSYLFQWHTSKY